MEHCIEKRKHEALRALTLLGDLRVDAFR